MDRVLSRALALVIALLPACSSESGATLPSVCSVGSRGCACTGGGSCDPDLACVDRVCIRAGGDGTGGSGISSGTGGSPGGGGTPGGGGAAVGPPVCLLLSGTHVATTGAPASCTVARSLSVVVSETGVLESIDGQTCTLSKASTDGDCFGIGDTYSCGGCEFTTGEDLNDRFLIGAADCDAPCAASHCCSLPTGGTVSPGYGFGPPEGGSGGATGAGGGGNTCGAFQSCTGCYDGCNSSCYSHPMGCTGPCYQACDRCCTR